MTNEELVEQIQKGNNVQEYMGILYQQNQPFIRKVVNPFGERADLEDLMQESYFFLVNAVNGYDPSFGVKFLTYAKSKIRYGCMEYVKNHSGQIRIPVYVQEWIRKYNRLVEECEGVPEKDYVMKMLRISQDQYDLMYGIMNQTTCVSLDKPLSDDGDLLMDLIPDGTDLEGQITLQEATEDLWKQVGMIDNERQRNIVLKRYRGNQTVTEIASEQNVTTQYISYLEKQALKKLKKMDRVKEIADYYGYDSHYAYSGRSDSVERIAIKQAELEAKYERLQKKFSSILSGVG